MPRNLVDAQMLESLLAPVVAQAGMELVDARHQVEQEGPVLRVLIEHPAATDGAARLPVSLEDCSRVNRLVSVALDEREDLFESAYRLEVSSPGLERPLVRASDYQRFAGSEARVSVRSEQTKRKSFSGTIVGVEGADVVLRETSGEETRIAVSSIVKAHLVHRF